MALIEVTLGKRWADTTHPAQTIHTLVPSAAAEFHPDDIFEALQRIGGDTEFADHLAADLDRIDQRFSPDAGYHPVWAVSLRHLRRSLDRYQAPSMSVGDTITVYTTPDPDTLRRTPLVTYTVEPIGWSSAAPTKEVTM